MEPEDLARQDEARNILREVLQERGLRPSAFVTLTESPQVAPSTLLRFLGNPRKTPPVPPEQNIRDETAWKIADAMRHITEPEETIGAFLRACGIRAPVTTHPEPTIASPLDPPELEQAPEFWITAGRRASFVNNHLEALQNYRKARERMRRRDYTWAKFSLEDFGQTLINLNAFEELDDTIAEVEREYLSRPSVRETDDGRFVAMLIDGASAWRDTWTGNTVSAMEHAIVWRNTSVELDGGRNEPDAFHWYARPLCEEATTAALFSELQLTHELKPVTRELLKTAANILHRQAGMHYKVGHVFGAAYGYQWEARVRRLLGGGEAIRAKELEGKWIDIFDGDAASAEADLDRAKWLLTDSDLTAGDLNQAERLLRLSLNRFQPWAYAPGMADALVSLAYITFLRGKASGMADLHEPIEQCIAALLLHPYPRHPIWRVARQLLGRLLSKVTSTELDRNWADIVARVRDQEGTFAVLKSVYAPASQLGEEELTRLRRLTGASLLTFPTSGDSDIVRRRNQVRQK